MRRGGGWRVRIRTTALLAAAGALALVTLAFGQRQRPAGQSPSRSEQAAQPGDDADKGKNGEEKKKDKETEKGIPITDQTVIDRCVTCHRQDEEGQLSRISFLRKTPEGWQTSIRRMVMLNDVRLEPEEAREMVRYLSNELGLAPEEVRPGFFDAERRMIDHEYTADEETFGVCKACHSMGRVLNQRRTAEEWSLLVAMHRGYYPIVDVQGFRSFEPPEDGQHPMDKAIAHLSQAFPLETPEWSAWKATMRPPRLEGRWAIAGYQAGKGPLFGVMTVSGTGQPDELETESRLVYAESGVEVERSGRAIVYTGFQWRGRTFDAGGTALREVMLVERDWQTMSGRWFTGDYDELGIDVTLKRIGGDPQVSGVVPPSLRRGERGELRIFGAALPSEISTNDVDLGPGTRVLGVERHAVGGAERLVVEIEVEEEAEIGARDLFVAGVVRPRSVVVFDAVSRIKIRPAAGMARVGGANFPKQLQQFEVVAFHDGPDGEPGTADDLELGGVDVEWSLEEYAVTYADDDLEFAGKIDDSGLFTPALDGPNPKRSGNRNNVGDLWVVATYHAPAARERSLEARAHLLVTVPLYMRWEPWRVSE